MTSSCIERAGLDPGLIVLYGIHYNWRMVSDLSKFVGIFSSIFFMICIFACLKRFKKFEYKKYALSDLANYKETAFLFNTGLFITAVLRIFYVFIIMEKLSLFTNLLITSFFYIIVISLLIVGLIPVSRNKNIHQFFGYLLYFASTIWLLLFHYYLLTKKFNLGSIGFVIALVAIVGSATLFYKHKKPAVPELFFGSMAILWDLFILYLFSFYP